MWLWDHAATSMRNGMVGRLCSSRAPGTIHAYQAVSEEINRSLGLATPPVRVFNPVQRKLPKLFSQERTGFADGICLVSRVETSFKTNVTNPATNQ